MTLANVKKCLPRFADRYTVPKGLAGVRRTGSMCGTSWSKTVVWQQSLQSPKSFDEPINVSSAHHGTPCCSADYTYGTHLWCPSLHQMILQLLPIILTIHYFLHIYNPETISLGEDIKAGGNTLCQGRSKDNITIGLLLTRLHRSQVLNWVNWGLVIEPNCQEYLIMIDWVGIWCNFGGTSFWTFLMVLKDAILVTGKGEGKGEESAEKG